MEHGAPESSPVLVTGASGFVGSAIAAVLRAEGFRPRALVRRSSPRTNITPLDTVCEGDLTDRPSLAAALKGVRFVFHAAADYRLWARDPGEIVRNNVEGTRLVMEECLRAGVERIVYTSSVATLRLADGGPADESRPLSEGEAIGAYKRSKIAAERLVEAMIRRDGLPAVIVNPSTPIGPRDVRPTPTGRIIVEAASGRMPAFVDTGLNLAHVDDVAAGHLAALRARRHRRTLYSRRRERLARRHAGRHRQTDRAAGRRCSELPRALLYPLAYAAESFARLAASEPFLTVDGLRMARHLMFFDDAKARRELGYVSQALSRGPGRRDRLVSRARAPAMIVDRALAFAAARHLGLPAAGQGLVLALPRARRRATPPNRIRTTSAARRRRHSGARRGRMIAHARRLSSRAGLSRALLDRAGRRSELGRHRGRRSRGGRPRSARPTACASWPAPRRRQAGPASSGRCVRASPALEAGEAPPEFILFTDADIAYAPQMLRRLVAIARVEQTACS